MFTRFRLSAVCALVALSLSLPSSSQAAEPYATGRVSGFTVVDGWFYFWLEGVNALCDSASGGGRNVGVVSAGTVADADSRRWMMSLLTTAMRGNRTVRVYTTNNTSGWGCRVTALGMD
jgi:hypothetical protein